MFALERAAFFDPLIGRHFLAFETGEALPEAVTHQVLKAGILIGKPLLKLANF